MGGVCVCVCKCMCCVSMWDKYGMALQRLHHHHAILKLIDFYENNHKRYHKMCTWWPKTKDPHSIWSMWNRFGCCESLGYKVCACTTNWFQWKPSLKWRNSGSHSFYNKTTHSDIFLFTLAGVSNSAPRKHSNPNYFYKAPARCQVRKITMLSLIAWSLAAAQRNAQ